MPEATVRELLAALEEVWRLQDQLFDGFSDQDWQQRHGEDWVFADVPYHLSYFDQAIADGLAAGDTLNITNDSALKTMGELDRWNDEKFAERPAGQTVEQAREGRRAAREGIRSAAASMTDASLDDLAWLPLVGIGWSTKGNLLGAALAHNYSEYCQLLFRAKRSRPMPTGRVVHDAIGFYMKFFPAFLNKEKAAGKTLTAVMAFTGEGAGAWTIRVRDGKATSSEGRAEDADFVMTQSPATFIKTFNGMQNPMLAILTGKVRVKGYRKLMTFGSLFAEPKPDQAIEPGQLAAPSGAL